MIHVIGDSHAGRLALSGKSATQGLTILPNHGQNVRSMTVTETADGLHLYSDNLRDFPALDIHVPFDCELIVFSGPLHSAPFTRQPDWQQFAPWHMVGNGDAPGHELISVSAFETCLERIFKAQTASNAALFEACRKNGMDIVVLEPPRLSARITRSAPPALLAAIDAAYRTRVRGMLAQHAVPVIDTPAETHDGSFMLEAFQAADPNDFHHGNDDYVALALQTIRAYRAAA